MSAPRPAAPDVPRGLAALLVGACVLFAAWAALRGLGSVLLFGDEFHSVRNLERPWLELARLFDRNGSGLLLPLLQKLAVTLLGKGLWSYRLPAIAGARRGHEINEGHGPGASILFTRSSGDQGVHQHDLLTFTGRSGDHRDQTPRD